MVFSVLTLELIKFLRSLGSRVRYCRGFGSRPKSDTTIRLYISRNSSSGRVKVWVDNTSGER